MRKPGAFERDATFDISNYRRACEGVSDEDPISKKVAEWRVKNAAKLLACRIPGVTSLHKDSCKAIRRNIGENFSDADAKLQLISCKFCEHSGPVKLNRIPNPSRRFHSLDLTGNTGIPDELFLNQAMRILKVSWNKITRLIRDGEIQARKIIDGDRFVWLITKASIEAYNAKRYELKAASAMTAVSSEAGPEWYTVKQVMKLFGKSEHAVGQWCVHGKIKCEKRVVDDRRKWMIPKSEIKRIAEIIAENARGELHHE